jgi:hypothetical protein
MWKEKRITLTLNSCIANKNNPHGQVRTLALSIANFLCLEQTSLEASNWTFIFRKCKSEESVSLKRGKPTILLTTKILAGEIKFFVTFAVN